jgi:ATP-binding cassette subfamily B protein
MASSNLRKTALLLRALMHYTAPRGDNKIRARIGAAFVCLIAAKSSNMVTPLLYGAAVDLVNGDSGFAMSGFDVSCWWICAGAAWPAGV